MKQMNRRTLFALLGSVVIAPKAVMTPAAKLSSGRSIPYFAGRQRAPMKLTYYFSFSKPDLSDLHETDANGAAV